MSRGTVITESDPVSKADSPQAMLEVEDLSFAYGEVQALFDVSLQVNSGEVACVMGRNGVGKTTLMKCIVGVQSIKSGSIKVGGKEVTTVPPHDRAKLGIGYVPQGRMIFPKLTIEENLRVGLSARTDGVREVPDEIYELFPVLKEMSRRLGGDLSGGQQQQLAIGRALAGNPSILLLDEPTEGIQPNIIQEIGKVLQKLVSEKQMTIVLVEQYLDFIREYSQRFYILNRGRVAVGDVTENLSDDLVERYLHV